MLYDLGEIRIGLYFVNLFGMAFAVPGDKQHPLIAIELLSHRTVDGVIAQVIVRLQEDFGLGTRVGEMLERGLGRAEAVGGLERLRCLGLAAAIWKLS